MKRRNSRRQLRMMQIQADRQAAARNTGASEVGIFIALLFVCAFLFQFVKFLLGY